MILAKATLEAWFEANWEAFRLDVRFGQRQEALQNLKEIISDLEYAEWYWEDILDFDDVIRDLENKLVAAEWPLTQYAINDFMAMG